MASRALAASDDDTPHERTQPDGAAGVPPLLMYRRNVLCPRCTSAPDKRK